MKKTNSQIYFVNNRVYSLIGGKWKEKTVKNYLNMYLQYL